MAFQSCYIKRSSVVQGLTWISYYIKPRHWFSGKRREVYQSSCRRDYVKFKDTVDNNKWYFFISSRRTGQGLELCWVQIRSEKPCCFACGRGSMLLSALISNRIKWLDAAFQHLYVWNNRIFHRMTTARFTAATYFFELLRSPGVFVATKPGILSQNMIFY